MKNKRNLNLDVLKGIAVIAVLLGHAIQRGLVEKYTENFLFKIIYTFHMPFFMILSGYALEKYTKNINYKTIIKKFNRLIIPTFIWSFIIYFMRDFSFVGIKPFIFFPDDKFVFIKTLFIYPTYIIWFLFQINSDKYGITTIKYYFPLFSLGYFVSPYKDKLLSNLKYMFIPGIIIYILLFKYFTYGYSVNIINYIIAISATIILWTIVEFINLPKIKIILSKFGEKSLEIYLCQCICLNIGFGKGNIRIISIFISATIISYLLSYITTNNKYLRILYGSYKFDNKDKRL